MMIQDKNAEIMRNILGGEFDSGRLYLFMHKSDRVADRVIQEITLPTLTSKNVEYIKPPILIHHNEYAGYDDTMEELTKMEETYFIAGLLIRNLNVHHLNNDGTELGELSYIAKLHNIPVIVYYKVSMLNDILKMNTINFMSRVTENCDFVASFGEPKDVIECHVMKNRQSPTIPEGTVKFMYVDV